MSILVVANKANLPDVDVFTVIVVGRRGLVLGNLFLNSEENLGTGCVT